MVESLNGSLADDVDDYGHSPYHVNGGAHMHNIRVETGSPESKIRL
jgi:hypothetical protein